MDGGKIIPVVKISLLFSAPALHIQPSVSFCFYCILYFFASESSTHSLRMGTKHFFPSGENKIIWKRFNSEPELIRFALLALVSGYTQYTILLLQVELFVRREKCTLPLRNLRSE